MYIWRTYSRVRWRALCQCGRHLITAPEPQSSTAGKGPRAVGALQVSLTRLACAAPNTALVRHQHKTSAMRAAGHRSLQTCHCGMQAITSHDPSWRRQDMPWRVWQPCAAPLFARFFTRRSSKSGAATPASMNTHRWTCRPSNIHWYALPGYATSDKPSTLNLHEPGLAETTNLLLLIS